MQAEGEASCDEAVLFGSGNEHRHFYAEIILGMIEGKNTVRTRLSTCFFYKGKINIKKRLSSILDTTRKLQWPAIPIMLTVMALTLFSGSVLAVQDLSTDTAYAALAAQPASAFSALPRSAPLKGIIEIALDKTGGGMVEEIRFEQKNGRPFCELIVRTNDKAYEIQVDSETGEIIEFREIVSLAELVHSAQVSFEKAMEIAIAKIGGGD